MKTLLVILLALLFPLVGALGAAAQVDEDGDGYEAGVDPGMDCDDDPSDDPPVCDACACGEAACGACARCIYPGAPEIPDDGIDNNCNGQADHFIVHAAFGTPSEPKLKLMRNFRDAFLLQSEMGRHVVLTYYRVSPPWAEFIDRHEPLRAACRVLLQPVFGLMWLLLHL